MDIGIAIMPETSIAPPAVSRPSKPVSEALLNEKVSSYPAYNPFNLLQTRQLRYQDAI
jgi:hypothetical protein